jgi:cell fate regulator YaaT (PSP1 superfamily)
MPDREFRRFQHRLDQSFLERFDRGGKQFFNMVQVRADRTRKVGWYYHDNDMTVGPGLAVVVETERGTGQGIILTETEKRLVSPKGARKVLRPLAEQGNKWQDSRSAERQQRARTVCEQLAVQMRLQLKLVDVEYIPWENRSVFFFSSDGRIDFRDLVKELSRNLRCRIEMRQIGPRDETKMVGGLGRCGREHCCSTHLTEFRSVRTKMAKEQGLVVNQEKITGNCRKLLCCLGYERETYAALREEMPKVGSMAETPDGLGRVAELHIMRQHVKVRLAEGNAPRDYPVDAFKPNEGEGTREDVQWIVKPKAVVVEKSDLERSLPGLADRMPEEEAPRRRRRGRGRSKGGSGEEGKAERSGQKSRPRRGEGGGGRSRGQRSEGGGGRSGGQRTGSGTAKGGDGAVRDKPAAAAGTEGSGEAPKKRRRRRRGRGRGKSGEQPKPSE